MTYNVFGGTLSLTQSINQSCVSGVVGRSVRMLFQVLEFFKMHTADKLSALGEGVHVEGMRDPRDFVVCRHDRQLYVADWDYCIWRVSVDDHSKYVKWLTSDTFHVTTLSMTSRHLLVTSSEPPTVRQYNTTNKQLLCNVQLPRYMWWLYHAVETTHDTFVVGHRGTSQDNQQYAVSELLRF